MRKAFLMCILIAILIFISCDHKILYDIDRILTIQIEGKGTIDPEEGNHDYIKGQIVKIKAIPIDSYDFVGWIGDVANRNNQTTTVTMDEDKTIKAVFEQKEYTVTFNGNGGIPEIQRKIVKHGETINSFPEVNKGGHRFIEWNTQIDGKGNTFTINTQVKSNKTIYAIWEFIPGIIVDYFVSDVKFNLVHVPAASFPTGVNNTGRETIEKPFSIGQTQVTYELWYTIRIWAEDNGYKFSNRGLEGSFSDHENFNTGKPSNNKNHPVTMVSWRDVVVWTNALSEKKGLNPVYRYNGNIIRDATNATACDNVSQTDNNGFRLPTTWEWELAARYIGTNRPSQTPLRNEAVLVDGIYWTPGEYASGAFDDRNNLNQTKAVAWFSDSYRGSAKSTSEVKELRANQLGIYDMSGNVWEWCYDLADSDYSSRILRGGCWYNLVDVVAVFFQANSKSYETYLNYGIRIARDIN